MTNLDTSPADAMVASGPASSGCELPEARSAEDLVPGDPAVLATLCEQSAANAAALRATSESVRAATVDSWQGSAADRFRDWHQNYLTRVDSAADVADTVTGTLTTYREALVTAQQRATTALRLYRAGLAGQAAATAPGSERASNATQQQHQATMAVNRAQRLLAQARTDLTSAAEHARDQLAHAVEQPPAHSPIATSHQPQDRPTPGQGHAGSRQPDAPPAGVRAVTVQPPHNGIHDSYARIAARTLGDARQWPTLWNLNRGRVLDGHSLTNANLIYPGDTIWVPAPPPPAVPVPPAPPGPTPTPLPPGAVGGQLPTPLGAPVTGPPIAPIPASPMPSPITTVGHGGGINIGGGLILAGGVAAALGGIAITATVVRAARRRPAQPDSAPVREPIDEPVVRRLTAATPCTNTSGIRPPEQQTTVTSGPPPLPLGVRDGREILVDVAKIFGIGLIGPGAPNALRALIVSVATSHPDAQILMPARDARALTVQAAPQEPGPLHVVDALPDMLDLAETELITRTRLLEEHGGKLTTPPLALFTRPDARHQHRLQAVADNGTGLGVLTIIWGDWPAGTTCHINTNGDITNAHGPGSEELIGTRAFTAPAEDTRQILCLLAASRDAASPASDDTTVGPEIPIDSPDGNADGTAAGKASKAPLPGTESSAAHPCVSLAPGPSPSITGSAPAVRQPVQEARNSIGPANGDRAKAEHQAEADKAHTAPALSLTILGPVTLTWTTPDGPRDLTAALKRKQRELVVYLALHRGVRRDELNEDIWPGASPARPFNSFYNTLSLLRHALDEATGGEISEITLNRGGRYALNPRLVNVDYWAIHDALAERRHAAREPHRLAALHRAVTLYHGNVAEDIAPEWIEPYRETIRRDVLDALGILIQAHTENDPDTRLDLLEQARRLDPYNEELYRIIVRAQAQLGRHDAIPRTIALLTKTLAENGQQPRTDTLRLAETLQGNTGARARTRVR